MSDAGCRGTSEIDHLHARRIVPITRYADPLNMLGQRRRVFVAGSDAEAKEKYESVTDIVANMLGFETAGQRPAGGHWFEPSTAAERQAAASPTTRARNA